MPRTYSAMTTLIVEKLQSAGTMDYAISEVDNQIDECLKELSHYQSHVVPVTLTIESRYGTCGSTSANNLIDTAKGQFKTTDSTDEKVVYNVHDRTWATITSVASTASVGLSRDIFTVGENYRLYNQKCFNNKQVYIGGMPDYVEIESVEYPIGQKRNFTILNDVLEIDVDSVADSDASSSKSQLPDVDVLVRFNRPHILTPLTDLVGKMAATAALGATTISGSSLQAAGTLSIGDEFYIQGLRNVYTVTTAATIATTASIAFYPPLECDVASTATTFTFVKSSLSSQQEELFADLTAARLATNKAPKLYYQANSAIASIASAATSIASMSAEITLAASALALSSTALALVPALVLSAGTAIAKIDAQVNAATTAIAAATALINTITVDDTPQSDWYNAAQSDLNVANGYLSEANGYVTQARADQSLAASYGQKAAGQLNLAGQYMNQAAGYYRQVSSQLSVSNSGRLIEAWGRSKLAEVLQRIRSDTKPKKSTRWPTE